MVAPYISAGHRTRIPGKRTKSRSLTVRIGNLNLSFVRHERFEIPLGLAAPLLSARTNGARARTHTEERRRKEAASSGPFSTWLFLPQACAGLALSKKFPPSAFASSAMTPNILCEDGLPFGPNMRIRLFSGV